MTATVANIAVLGASGYTGAELLRLLAGHGGVRVAALSADRKAGQHMGEVFPHLAAMDLPVLSRIEDIDFGAMDAVFCGLPHGTTQEVVAELPASVKVVDLSADFRLKDTDLYAEVYGKPHAAPELQKTAVYGLTELARDDVRAARLVACPGCYPTSAQLPLIPLLRAGLIAADPIIIDAKSGVSGAGRAAKEGSLHTEVSEGLHAYGVGTHRHGPEIDQGLSATVGSDVTVSFTPHLVPMNRGILATIYVRCTQGADADSLRVALSEAYAGEPFVSVLPAGETPHTRHVRGSNQARIAVFPDRRPGTAILCCAIDNLVKGASGQAVQNFNLMMGFEETAGLTGQPLFP